MGVKDAAYGKAICASLHLACGLKENSWRPVRAPSESQAFAPGLKENFPSLDLASSERQGSTWASGSSASSPEVSHLFSCLFQRDPHPEWTSAS